MGLHCKHFAFRHCSGLAFTGKFNCVRDIFKWKKQKNCGKGCEKLITALRTYAFSPQWYTENNSVTLKGRRTLTFPVKIPRYRAWTLFQSIPSNPCICLWSKGDWAATGASLPQRCFLMSGELHTALHSHICRCHKSSPPPSRPSPVLFAVPATVPGKQKGGQAQLASIRSSKDWSSPHNSSTASTLQLLLIIPVYFVL